MSEQRNTIEEARRQAADKLGFIASRSVSAGDFSFEIPNPSMLDDEQQARYDALELDIDQNYERYPDALNEDGSIRVRGALMVPNRYRDPERGAAENYNIRLAKAILGDRDHKKFVANGGRSSDIQLIWTQMNVEMAERQRNDSKSAGGTGDVAPVSDGD